MAEPETKCCCFKKPRCISSAFIEYLKRKKVGIFFTIMGWAVTIPVFIQIKDEDWNIAVIPYFLAFVGCALVSALCERGRFDHERLGDIYRLQAGIRRRNQNPGFGEVLDSDVSPLLSGLSRDVTAEIALFRADPRPLGHADELFEPAPVVFQKSNEGASSCQRDTQVTVQADVHRPVQGPPSPTLSPEHPGGSSSSASDPHNSSTTPDSGVALQSTAQSTPSGSGGPIPRPPAPIQEKPQQDPANPISPTEKSTRF